MKKALMGLIVALSIAVITPALAAFPEQNLQDIIQWGSGGSADIIMRSVTPHAETVLRDPKINNQ